MTNSEEKIRNCPALQAIALFSGKWKPPILWYLMQSPKRFNELKRLIPQASQTMLTRQLRDLAKDGLIIREVIDQSPIKVVYTITPLGKSIKSVFTALDNWAKKVIPKVDEARKLYNNNSNT